MVVSAVAGRKAGPNAACSSGADRRIQHGSGQVRFATRTVLDAKALDQTPPSPSIPRFCGWGHVISGRWGDNQILRRSN